MDKTNPAILIVENLQYWTPENPCSYCGSPSNTGHGSKCPNAGLYDDRGYPIPATRKVTMDELVYFSASFHCIPLRVADQIRELLMGIDTHGSQFNFDYSQPIIQEELE